MAFYVQDKNLERKLSNNNLVQLDREEPAHPQSKFVGQASTSKSSGLKRNSNSLGNKLSDLGEETHATDHNGNYHTVHGGINALPGARRTCASAFHSKSSISIHTPEVTARPDPVRQAMLRKVEEVKNKIKMQFPDLEGDHDVLVIGAHDVGKSSMINSLWLSMTGETEERSPPVGKPYNYAPIPIYRRKTTYSPKSGIRINGGSLKFWDTRGFQKVNQVSRLATLFRFILEGRMAPGYFHQALMLSEDTVIKNCRKIDISRANIYKAVIFIERENPTPAMEVQTQKLAEALQKGLSRSKFHAVKNIPIIRVKNGAEQEVRSLGSRGAMASVSSCESLSEVGMPSQQHNIESYCWSVNYTEFDLDEIDSDDSEPTYAKVQPNEVGEFEEVPESEDEEENEAEGEEGGNSDSGMRGEDVEESNTQYALKMNIKPSNRFEFAYRLGPSQEELTPEKHLSLLLFLNNLLTIICHPDSEDSKKWRFDKNAVKFSDKKKVSCTHAIRNLLRRPDGRRTGN